MSQEMAKYESAQAGDITTFSDPKKEVDRARQMAQVLQDVVRQAGLSKKFGGQKEHLFFEAWQTIGRFFNCVAGTEWSKPIMHGDKIIGWEAKAVVRNHSGVVVAAAESMCALDEQNWKGKPQYAIRSMAQTRASSKALRQAFAWVAVLAGYSATPAEEMSADFNGKQAAPQRQAKPPSRSARTAPAEQVREFVKQVAVWFRHGDYLTKDEAVKLIEDWDDVLNRYEAERSMVEAEQIGDNAQDR